MNVRSRECLSLSRLLPRYLLELDPFHRQADFLAPTANLVTKLGALAVLSIKVEAEAPQGWGELSQLRKAVSNFELSVACIMQMRVMKRDKADWY